MSDETQKDGRSPQPDLPAQPNKPGNSASPGIDTKGSSTNDTAASTVSGPAEMAGQSASTPLTKEEQWALFEKELKENDWGHQPC